MTSTPVVQVWKPGASSWVWADLPITDYTALSATVEHLGFGGLDLSLPVGHSAVPELLIGLDEPGVPRQITVDTINGRFGTFLPIQPRVGWTGVGRKRRLLYQLQGAANALELLSRVDLFPNPAQPLSGQDDEADVYPGGNTDVPAEDVIHHFLVANFGNRWAEFGGFGPIIDPSLSRGPDVRGRGRFQTLWQLVRNVALNGGLGVSIGLVDTTPGHAQLHVSCYLPTDKSESIVFSADRGTLRSWEFTASPATVDRAIVGDAGSGATRRFVDRTRGTPVWGGYRETFIPSDSFDIPALQQAGDAALKDGVAGSSFELTTVDTEGVTYNVDYGLGDTATVDIGLLSKAAPVASVTLTVGQDGVHTKPVIGDPTGNKPMFQFSDLISALGRRLTDRERT